MHFFIVKISLKILLKRKKPVALRFDDAGIGADGADHTAAATLRLFRVGLREDVLGVRIAELHTPHGPTQIRHTRRVRVDRLRVSQWRFAVHALINKHLFFFFLIFF